MASDYVCKSCGWSSSKSTAFNSEAWLRWVNKDPEEIRREAEDALGPRFYYNHLTRTYSLAPQLAMNTSDFRASTNVEDHQAQTDTNFNRLMTKISDQVIRERLDNRFTPREIMPGSHSIPFEQPPLEADEPLGITTTPPAPLYMPEKSGGSGEGW